MAIMEPIPGPSTCTSATACSDCCETKAEGVVFVSGDRRRSGLAITDSGLHSPLYDLTAGFIEEAKAARSSFPGRPDVKGVAAGHSCFGVISIDWDKTDPAIRLQIRDEANAAVFENNIARSLLKANSAPKETYATVGSKLATVGSADESSDALKIDGKAVTAKKQIGELVGKEIKLDMKVASVGKNKTGTMIFLNSADRKSPENFTVVLDKKGIESLKKAGVADPLTTYKTRTVRVIGVVTSFQDRHEIIVSDAAKIKLVEKEKDKQSDGDR